MRKGQHHTEEARAKISKANVGRPRPDIAELVKNRNAELVKMGTHPFQDPIVRAHQIRCTSERLKRLAKEGKHPAQKPGFRAQMSERMRTNNPMKNPEIANDPIRITRLSQWMGGNNPIRGKHHSEETRRKISESHKGKVPWNKGKTGIYSDETRARISATLTGNIPWNKGKRTGYTPWNKGLMGRSWGKHTEETKQKLSAMKAGKTHKGIPWSKEQRKKMVVALKKRSESEWQINHTKAMQTPEFQEKRRRGLRLRPSKSEWSVIEYIRCRMLPVRYTGDFREGYPHPGTGVMLYPDLTHYNKREVWEIGTALHDPVRYEKVFKRPIPMTLKNNIRKMLYADLGVRCTIISEKQAANPDFLDHAFASRESGVVEDDGRAHTGCCLHTQAG